MTTINPKKHEMRNLKLLKPILFLDIQTTGLDTRTARIVRLSTLKIQPDGTEEFRSAILNPMTPISPGATQIHGITNEQVEDAPTFQSYAKALQQYIQGCDIAGFAIRRFDIKILKNEFRNAGITLELEQIAILDAMEVFHKLQPRDFQAACKTYLGTDPPDSKDPEANIHTIRKIIDSQINSNHTLPDTPAQIDSWVTGAAHRQYIDNEGRFIWSEQGEAAINFGKYRGHSLQDLSQFQNDYLLWIAQNESFTPQQREIAADAAEGIIPQKT